MANQNVFCNVPWTNLHIYWDGSFGACCYEDNKPFSSYNLNSMSIAEWYNSSAMKQLRRDIQGDGPLSMCSNCYKLESSNYESKRIKENFKSVIFTKEAFDKSFQQSPWYNRFNSALDNADQKLPIEWHVDLGNECNLSCKMCAPEASSVIASKYRKWNIKFEDKKNWVNDPVSWNNFIDGVTNIPINRLHIMGGEPMISKRFKELIDYLIDIKKTDISISFVTNGTIYDQTFIDKLKKFRLINVEVSIESITDTNHYIRQGIGNSTQNTIANIEALAKQQSGTFQVVLRSVPQLLNIGSYDQYITWAWDSKLCIEGLILAKPEYLSIPVLPYNIRQNLIPKFIKVKEQILKETEGAFTTMSVGRDVSRIHIQLIKECDAIINLLKRPEPNNVKELRQNLATWLMRWDKEFNLNAFEFYPEYTEFLNEIQYRV